MLTVKSRMPAISPNAAYLPEKDEAEQLEHLEGTHENHSGLNAIARARRGSKACRRPGKNQSQQRQNV